MKYIPTLRWSKRLESNLLSLVKPGTWKCGCTCHFIPLSKKVGAKFYNNDNDNEDARDHSWEFQKRAEKIKLAPKTGSKFIWRQLDFYNGEAIETWHGYLTEIAKPLRIRPRLNKIENQLETIGIYHSDLHEGNVMQIRNRRCCRFRTRIL